MKKNKIERRQTIIRTIVTVPTPCRVDALMFDLEQIEVDTQLVNSWHKEDAIVFVYEKIIEENETPIESLTVNENTD